MPKGKGITARSIKPTRYEVWNLLSLLIGGNWTYSVFLDLRANNYVLMNINRHIVEA